MTCAACHTRQIEVDGVAYRIDGGPAIVDFQSFLADLDTAVGTVLPLPYFGTFHETNIRLYSIDAEGRHGVLFLSLETARLAVVPVVRAALGVPYTWARMRITRTGDRISYESERRWPRRGLRSRLTVVAGPAAACAAR